MPITTTTARIINVANAAQLSAAIQSARGGETILLAAGNYGALTIKNLAMASTVTIKSADPAHDAVISDLRVSNSSNFRFEDIDLHRVLAPGEADFTQAAYISKSSNIAIVGVDFTGSLDGNAANDGTGLRITGGQNISITGSTFEQWKLAVMLSDTTGLTVSGNTLTSVVKSFSLSGLQDGSFTDNRFVGAKADWNTGPIGGTNLTFANNSVAGVTPAAEPVPGTGPKTVNVATQAQLSAALAAAKGGETILLAPGDYGQLTIVRKSFADTVTIKSADSAHDASLTGLRVADSAGIVFDDIDVHRVLAAGEADFVQAAYVSGSSRISFIGVDFTGSMDNNAWNDGVGLRVSYSRDVKILDSTFEQLNNAIVFDHDTGLTVVGNTVTAVREGFDFAAVHNVVIAQNLFTAFQPNWQKSDHSDAIQFWNNRVDEGSTHVAIRDNVILQGVNYGSQGIFIRAENPAFRHSDFVIENNLYNGDARHGITVTGTNGAVIRGNTVTSAPGGMLESGISIGNTSNVIVEKNIAPLLLDNGNNTALVWRDNVDIWDSKTGKGAALAGIFAGTATGGDIAAYAVKASGATAALHAGFTNLDGIGAASFDLANLASYSHLAGVLVA